MSRCRVPTRYIGIAAVTGLASLPTFAQENDTTVLDDVFVMADQDGEGVRRYQARRSGSATKTDTPLDEVPQAVSVIPATVLDDLRSPVSRKRWTTLAAWPARTTSAA